MTLLMSPKKMSNLAKTKKCQSSLSLRLLTIQTNLMTSLITSRTLKKLFCPSLTQTPCKRPSLQQKVMLLQILTLIRMLLQPKTRKCLLASARKRDRDRKRSKSKNRKRRDRMLKKLAKK